MENALGFIPYGSTWRHLRQEFHTNFRPKKLEAFRPVEQRAVNGLLRNLLASPEKFSQHLRQ
jgi:cytochrome P450